MLAAASRRSLDEVRGRRVGWLRGGAEFDGVAEGFDLAFESGGQGFGIFFTAGVGGGERGRVGAGAGGGGRGGGRRVVVAGGRARAAGYSGDLQRGLSVGGGAAGPDGG